jgi:hypothetical protein
MVSSGVGICGFAQWRELYLAVAAALGISFYFGAGIAKLAGVEWRDGRALSNALSTSLFGTRYAAAFFGQHATAARLVCWGIIFFEVAVVLVLFLPSSLVFYFWVVLAILFHASICILMRLPVFLLAAFALLPGLSYVHHSLHL